MALQHNFHARPSLAFHRIYNTQSSGDQKESFQEATIRLDKSPAEEFSPLASRFRRRLLIGTGSASLVALGANFAGITSFILGFSPQTGRNLKLDILYPIGGYNRCIDINEGFEFIYPVDWVGDQTLLYRAAGKAEFERSLDPPPLTNTKSIGNRWNINEPVAAFGPPGSTGELNVSVIVSPVPLDFSIDAFGGPKEVGEQVIRTITGASRRADIKGTLISSELRSDSVKNVNYYQLEYRIESSAFERHNIAVCCARGGRLYTLNAQSPESKWWNVKSDFYKIADSFNLTN
uniref:Photosystem II reaction center PsbP family protein n=1 Tax=Francoa sonchifolia TaxID=23250 RepID=A0A0F7H1I0_9ROSI